MIPILQFNELSPEDILNRDIRQETGVDEAVDAVLAAVRERGDDALRDYTRRFDGAEGRLLRRLPGMDQPYFRYPLLHRFRNGAASLPYHGQGSDHRCQHFRPGRQGLRGHRPLAQKQ